MQKYRWSSVVIIAALVAGMLPIRRALAIYPITVCQKYTIIDGSTGASWVGKYCWVEFRHDSSDEPILGPELPGGGSVPNPAMCISTINNWPSDCSKAKRPFASMNGCGSGANESLVPDNYGPVGFTGSCNAHDACYGTFGKSKASCDTSFRNNLKSNCLDYYTARISELKDRYGPRVPLSVYDQISHLNGEMSVCKARADYYYNVLDSNFPGGPLSAYNAGQVLGRCVKAHDDKDKYCGI